MKILDVYINTPTMVLVLVCAIILVLSDQIFGSIHLLVWTVVVLLLMPRLASYLYGETLDNPPPVIYPLHAPGVWAQISETLRTTKADFDGVDASLEWDNYHPQPGKPMYMQAIINVSEPDLAWLKDYLPEEQKNLRSKIVMDAWIDDLNDKSRLTLKFRTKFILFRTKHNQVISQISTRIHNLIHENIPN